LREELPRLADEGLPLLVLVGAGPLADEHQLGARVAGPEDERRAPAGELAAGALAEVGADGEELGGGAALVGEGVGARGRRFDSALRAPLSANGGGPVRGRGRVRSRGPVRGPVRGRGRGRVRG